MTESNSFKKRATLYLFNKKEKIRIFFTLKPEHERFSKFENAVEGICLYIIIVLLVYRLVFQEIPVFENFFRTVVMIYICGVGPIIHNNSPQDLGVGNFRKLKEELFNRKKRFNIFVSIILIFISILVFPLFLREFSDVLKLVPALGQLNMFVADHAPLFQIPLAVLEYILFQVLLVLFLIRKDNFKESFKNVAKPCLYLLLVVFGLSLISLELFRVEGTILDFLAIWYGYTFWGLMQQIPFLVYFSTRFRKGLPFNRASEVINVALLAFFFGFFHAPQWILVIIGSLMEIVLARMFLKQETRNLFVAGLIHGFFGTLIIFFTGLYIKMDFV